MDVATLAELLHETAERDQESRLEQASGHYLEEVLHVLPG